MAGNWGLVANATANAPQQTLEELLANAAAKADAERKAAIEQRKLGQEDARIGVSQGDLQLNRDKFGNEVSTAKAGDAEREELLKTLPSWLVPAAKLRHAFGMTVDPRDVAMSPEDQRTQALADEKTKADAAMALHQAPTYKDLHPKKPVVEIDPFTSSGGVLSGFRPVGGQKPTAGAGAVGRDGGEVDEAFLSELAKNNPQMAAKVKMLAEGTFPMPTGNALKDPGLQQAITFARRYDPSFEGANYANRAATQKNFTSGPTATQVNDLNTAILHVANLDKSIEGLSNFGGLATPLNYVKNFFGSVTHSDPAISRFNVDRKRVGSEITSAYDKGGGALADRESAQDDFSLYGSPDANKAAVGETIRLLKGKINSLDDQYARGMGSKRFTVRGLLSKEAQSAYDELMKRYGGDESATPHETSGAAAPPAGWVIKK